jgi:transposase
MLYLAIDQHKAQLTINLRNEHGDVVQKGQVSTKHASINDFFDVLVKKARQHRGFMSIVEVCGFNDWLLEKLKSYGCKEIVVVQPDKSSKTKTDKRDANVLGELLWNNRKRLQGDQRPNGIRRIFPADSTDAEVRQLTNFRQFLITQRTKVINKIKGIFNKHNMLQDAPTECIRTKKFRNWVAEVKIPDLDRMEIDIYLEHWQMYDKQIVEVEMQLARRSETNPNMLKLKSIPGISAMGAIILLSRIGDIKRFKTPRSLANYFGLTPGCHNTAGKQRIGGITKAGSPAARQVLNFAILHVVRKDKAMRDWYKKIKHRKGTKTARVAGMRKLATIIWHMLRWDKEYQFRYDPPASVKKQGDQRPSKKVLEGINNKNQCLKKGKTPSTCKAKSKA